MRFFPRTIILMLLAVATLTVGMAADAPQSGQNASPPFDPGSDSNRNPVSAQEKVTGLKMSIRASAPESTDSLQLHVTFENVSDKDTVINLGMMLGNGKVHLPDAVRLILTDPSGQSRELHFSDTRIAGRVDCYAVPLRAGSAYTLKLSLKNYWCPKSKEVTLALKPERYRVHAEFTGNSAKHLNRDTEGLKFMPFWTGKLKSNVAQFQIGKEKG